MHIHGGTKENVKLVLDGIIDTMTSKFKSKDICDKLLRIDTKHSLVNKLKNDSLTAWSKGFSLSNENLLRSLNVYYSHNVMGKNKYINIRKANGNASFQGNQIPNYVPYSVLSNKINQIDIGTTLPLTLHLSDGQVDGMYRPLADYALRLVKFYLRVNNTRKDKLKQFHFLKREILVPYCLILQLEVTELRQLVPCF